MAIVTRVGKGSKLTIEEMDNNLLSLESGVSDNVSTITSKLDKGTYTGSAKDLDNAIAANVTLIASKLDKGAYTGTAKDLENAITAAVTGASGISIVPTSPAPSGTGIASFTATQAGTYTNYGGLVVSANSFAIISRSAAGVFSISQTPFDLTSFQTKVNVQAYNLTKELGGFYTLASAVAAVPTNVRKIGLNIAFNLDAITVEDYEFISDSITNFSFVNYWVNKKITSQKDIKIDLKIRDYVYQNAVIAANGSLFGFGVDYASDFFITAPGERFSLKSRLDNSSSNLKIAYGFFNGAPSASTFISGSTATGSEIVTNEVVVVPAGATVIGMSYKKSYPFEIVKLNNYDFITNPVLNTIFIESRKTVSNTSVFGILGNGQGMLEVEARDAFGKVYTSEPVYCGYVNYLGASLGFYITLFKTNGTEYGKVYNINPADTSYKLMPILNTDAQIQSKIVLGFVSIKGFGIKRAMYGLFSSKIVFNFNEFEYKEILEAPKQATQIITWGDSLTSIGSGYGNDFTPVGYMASIYGIGGETSLQIAARIGSIPYEINAEFTIPSGTTATSISLRSSWTRAALFPRENYGIQTCSIRGIDGNLIVTSAGSAATFTRLVAGTATLVKKGEKLISYGQKQLSNEIQVIWMGQNGGYTSEADLVNQYLAVTRNIASGKYLVLTAHLNTTDSLELLMQQTFGSKYINTRQWCVNYALAESGITPTQADLDAIALGNCPPSLLVDGTHFVTAAKLANANLVKNRLLDLKFIS
jgi:hypothetical protein